MSILYHYSGQVSYTSLYLDYNYNYYLFFCVTYDKEKELVIVCGNIFFIIIYYLFFYFVLKTTYENITLLKKMKF